MPSAEDDPLFQAHGHAISAAPSIEAENAPGERRHLTLMFCDLVGSTGIAKQLDPEDWRELAASYLDAVTQAVERFGGYVAKTLGDGLVAYFGYPHAHEDDPHRSILAGLAIIEAVEALNRRSANKPQPTLAVRIGIDNGPVVVSEGDGKGAEVYGNSPNIAARVQTAAEPDTPLITGAVHQLVSGLFVVEDTGEHQLKGVESPLRLFRVLQPSGKRDRLAVATAQGLTPFFGREDELRLLINRWKLAREGEGQVILVVGEAGIGKSRLLQHFAEQIADTPHKWVACGAAALHQNTPFYAISEMLHQCIRARGGQDVKEGLEALEASLAQAGVKLEDGVPLIAPLLNLAVPFRYPPPAMSPEQQRKRLLATITSWALGIARNQLLVIAVEDLHWADPSTVEAIQLVAEQAALAPLMLICTARPEFRAPWPLRAHHTQLTLNRLSARAAHEMVACLAADAALGADTVDALVERSGGVPLFVEELTRAVLESDAAQQAAHHIPATLQDSLMARLDRLGTAREVAQVASVLGHEFSWALLSAVTAMDDEKLEASLRKLEDTELLLVQGIPPEASYRFKHALIQDAAYQSLLRSRRRHYHRRTARILEQRFPEITLAQPELLAHHYTEANLKAQAIPQWQMAGRRAMERSANAEAVSHFTRALELLNTTPTSPERFQQELALQIALGTPLITIKGFGSAEVGAAYGRARELCQQAGESPQVFPVLWGLWMFYMARAEHAVARQLAEQCLHLAKNTGDSGFLVQAHHVTGVGLIAAGRFSQALEHLNQVAALYDPVQHGSHPYIYGHDPAAVSLTHAGWALWFLGYPDQALRKGAEGLALALKFKHPYTSASVDAFVAWLHQFRRNSQIVEELASAALTISTEHDFPFYRAMGIIMRGWARAQRAQKSDGIEQMRAGLEAYHLTGAAVLRPGYLSLLAEGYGNTGRAKEGLGVLAEAQQLADRCQEHWWDAELHRLRGELTLKQADTQGGPQNESEAEQCFRQALSVAQEQKAKSLELRAAMSLSRLWLRQSRRREAKQVLGDVFGFFTEGFDTPDLIEAKTLLERLART
jgi:class 3 adenylate cyclase/predicted ATPase